MRQPHVEIILTDDTIPAGLEDALRLSDASASFRPLSDAIRNGRTPSADAFVVVAPENTRAVADHLRVLFHRLAEEPRATLVLKSSGKYMPHLAHPPRLPVSFGSGLDAHELAVRIATMLEMRHSLESMHREVAASRATDDGLQQQHRNQLRLARKVQLELLPEVEPRFGAVSFKTVYRPADYISGDIYDIQRLDEQHVGVALADAGGKGIPAALLTVYIKKALRGKETRSDGYRLLGPDEVLARLNHEIVEADLPDCPFVAIVYAVINMLTGETTIARGGAPYPVWCRNDGSLELLRPDGPIVGILPDAEFETITLPLQRGDTLLFYSDGFETLAGPQITAGAIAQTFERAADMIGAGTPKDQGGNGVTVPRPHGDLCAERMCVSLTSGPPSEPPWFAGLRERGVSATLDQIVARRDLLERIGHPLDDLTAIAIQVDA
jgi:hypothetical protein